MTIKWKHDRGAILKIFLVSSGDDSYDPPAFNVGIDYAEDFIEAGLSPCKILHCANYYRVVPEVLEMEEGAYLSEYFKLLCKMEYFAMFGYESKLSEFLRENHEKLVKLTAQDLLSVLVHNSAHECVAALLKSQLKSHIDVNIHSSMHWDTPLRVAAAERLSFDMTQLLLQHGGDPDFLPNVHSKLVLDDALHRFSDIQPKHGWKKGDSFFKLFVVLSLPEMKEPLETIKLLASQSKQVENLCRSYILNGQVFMFATLLKVAWDKLVVQLERGLGCTPVGQYILEELKREVENYELSRSETQTSNDSISKIKNLVDALHVLKTFCLVYGALDRCGPFSTEGEPKCEPLIDKAYELISDLESSTVNKDILLYMSSKLTLEAKELSQKHHDHIVRAFTKEQSMGVVGSRAWSLRANNSSYRAFYTRQDANFNHQLKHLETRLLKLKPSSHNVLGLTRWVAPIMWLAKRSIK